MRSFRLITVLGLTALLAACGAPQVSDVGGGSLQGDDDDDGSTPSPEPEGSFVVSVTSAPLVMDLNVASSVNFTVTPADGFTGVVNVTLPINAAGITGLATTVNVDGAAPVNGSIDVDTTTYASVIPGKYTDLVLHAAAGEVVSEAMVEATINPTLLLHIKAGAGNAVAAPDVWGADAAGDGIIVHFGKDAAGAPNATFQIAWINDDAVNHTIHAGGNATQHGIQHGATNQNNDDANGNPGATQMRTINRNGTTLDPNIADDSVLIQPNAFYCHNHLGTNLASGHAAKITLLN